jgi:hypothetical protein
LTLQLTQSNYLPSAFSGSNAEFFKEIAANFLPVGSRVLDANWGYGGLWRMLLGQTDLHRVELPMYEVIRLDARKMPNVMIVGSDGWLPLCNGAVDGVVFDPPYAGTIQHGQRYKKDGAFRVDYESKWESARNRMNYDKLRALIERVGPEFNRVIRPSGCLIMKSAEFREKGEFFPISAFAWQKWNGFFQLAAWLIQVIPVPDISRKSVEKMQNPVVNAHNTWTVWRHKNYGK